MDLLNHERSGHRRRFLPNALRLRSLRIARELGRSTSLARVRRLCSRERQYPTRERPKAHPHWLNYIRVEDAVKMTAKVVALGGRVLVEPRVDRHGGKVAVVADPLGAPFGLLEWTSNT